MADENHANGQLGSVTWLQAVGDEDRPFIDKVANRRLIFDGRGNTELFEGNWTLWQAIPTSAKK